MSNKKQSLSPKSIREKNNVLATYKFSITDNIIKKAVVIIFTVLLLSASLFGCDTKNSNTSDSDNKTNTDTISNETQDDKSPVSEDNSSGEKDDDKENEDIINISSCDNSFSDGVCWVKTNNSSLALIDTAGKALYEIDDDKYNVIGDYHNGVALVETEDGIKHFIDKKGRVVFSSNDKEYGDMIYGMHEGGYIYLVKNDVSFEASKYYHALITYNREFKMDWEEVSDFPNSYYFMYHGDGLYSTVDEVDECTSVIFHNYKNEPCFLYIDEYDINNDYDGIDAQSLIRQPKLIAEGGWMIVNDDDNKIYHNTIIINTRTGKAYNAGNHYDSSLNGFWSDDCIVLIGEDNGKVERLAIFDTATCEYKELSYKYMDRIVLPGIECTPTYSLIDNYLKFGFLPAFNVYTEKTMDPSIVYRQTDYIDMNFSNGAMLLGLKGMDNQEYYALMDKNGNSIIEPTLGNAVKTIGEGLFLVNIDGKKTLINEKGQFVEILEGYSILNIEKFSEGLAYVSLYSFDEKNRISGFIDSECNFVINFNNPLAFAN